MTERALLNAINNGATINFIKGLEAKKHYSKKEIEEIEEQIVLKNQKLIITLIMNLAEQYKKYIRIRATK